MDSLLIIQTSPRSSSATTPERTLLIRAISSANSPALAYINMQQSFIILSLTFVLLLLVVHTSNIRHQYVSHPVCFELNYEFYKYQILDFLTSYFLFWTNKTILIETLFIIWVVGTLLRALMLSRFIWNKWLNKVIYFLKN